MATNETLIPIPGRLHSVATEGHVAGADEIYDDTLGKSQSTINGEVDEVLDDVALIDTGSSSPAVVPEFDPESETVHVTAQTLSEQQKVQVRTNIGLNDLVKYSEQTLTTAQKDQVAANLNNKNATNGMARIELKATDDFKAVVEAQTGGNTIFVIKYDFTLTGNVTIPANCVLEFDGGSISGDYYIDFRNCLNQQIYYSWFGEFDTCNKSLPYMAHKELVIDRNINLTEPFYLPENNFTVDGLTIRGAKDLRFNQPTITSDNFQCFLFYCHGVTIKDLSFDNGGYSVPCVELHCSKEYGPQNDVDSVVKNCQFLGGVGIKCVGRGLLVEDCIFKSTGSEGNPGCATISLYPGYEGGFPNYPTAWHNPTDGVRAITIRNNRFHTSYNEVFVGMYANKGDMFPSVSADTLKNIEFTGVTISDNLVDCNGTLCVISAKNNGTMIKGNTINKKFNSSAMVICNGQNMIISCNNIGSIERSSTVDSDNITSDIRLANISSVSNTLADPGSSIKQVIISNNIFESYNNSIEMDSLDSACDIIVSNNMYGEKSFSRFPRVNNGAYGERAIVFSLNTKVRRVTISNNLLPYNFPNATEATVLYSYIAERVEWTPDEGKDVEDIIIEGNKGFKNYLLKHSAEFGSPIYINKKLQKFGPATLWPTNLEESDAGYMFVIKNSGECRPVFWAGNNSFPGSVNGWVNALGESPNILKYAGVNGSPVAGNLAKFNADKNIEDAGTAPTV